MIETKRLILRHFIEEDIETVWKWKNDSGLSLYERSDPYAAMSRNEIRDNYIGNKDVYAIYLKGDPHKLIGEASFWFPNTFSSSTVEVGISVSEGAYREKGFGTEVSLAIGRKIFNNPKIHKIVLCVGGHNHHSKSPLGKMVKQEGVIRKDRFIDGEYYDTYVFGLLRDEFNTLINRVYRKETEDVKE